MDSKIINEYPLLVLPSLAVTIGLNEAIMLQQVHFWCTIERKRGRVEGERAWVKKSVGDWCEDFTFWSSRTIQRVISNLENAGLLDSKSDGYDRTKSYAVNYEVLAQYLKEEIPCDVCKENVGEHDAQYTDEDGQVVWIVRCDECDLFARTPAPNRAEKQKARTLQAIATFQNKQDSGEIELEWLDSDLIMLGQAFLNAVPDKDAYKPLKSDQSKWRKLLRQMALRGIAPRHIEKAVKKMRKDGLTIGGLQSIEKVAIDIKANERKKDDYHFR